MLKKIIPLKIKVYIAKQLRGIRLSRGIQTFKNLSDKTKVTDKTLQDIIQGWGNTGWSADTNYLREIINCISDSNINVLECGSGISSVIMGIAAPDSKIYSLEHTPEWANKVRLELSSSNISNVKILDSKIKTYGDFDWYDDNEIKNYKKFDVIVCDGPPSITKEGRYGLMPVMSDRLNTKCTILLDDTVRKEERDIMNRWKEEYNQIDKIILKTPYSIITLK